MSLLEAVAYLSGEPHTHEPQSVCPVLGAFGECLEEEIFPSDLDELLPYAAKLVGTRGTSDTEQRRAYHFADRAVREFAPIVLEVAGYGEMASELQSLAQVCDVSTALLALQAAKESEAWSVAQSASRQAALQQGRMAKAAILGGLPGAAEMMRAAEVAQETAWSWRPEHTAILRAKNAVSKAQAAQRTLTEMDAGGAEPERLAEHAYHLRISVAKDTCASVFWAYRSMREPRSYKRLRLLALATLDAAIDLK